MPIEYRHDVNAFVMTNKRGVCWHCAKLDIGFLTPCQNAPRIDANPRRVLGQVEAGVRGLERYDEAWHHTPFDATTIFLAWQWLGNGPA